MESIVETNNGFVEGVWESDVFSFKGIPYAQPLSPEKRFTNSSLLQGVIWSRQDPFQAHLFGAPSPQDPRHMEDIAPHLPMSDNCLSLNIWTPDISSQAKLPVMVWIHGGGNISGTTASPYYHGEKLAAKGHLIIVTVNYRLGILGFLYHEKLQDSKGNNCGNWGFLDQITALQWIAENIAQFGGDPQNITLFGESAGAAHVGLHLVHPRSSRYFHKAILQSGFPSLQAPKIAQRASEEVFKAFSLSESDSSAHIRETLSSVPISDFIALTNKFSSSYAEGLTACRPTFDQISIPFRPLEGIRHGICRKKQILLGTNKDEVLGVSIPKLPASISTWKDFKEYLRGHLRINPLTQRKLTLDASQEISQDVSHDVSQNVSQDILDNPTFLLDISKKMVDYYLQHNPEKKGAHYFQEILDQLVTEIRFRALSFTFLRRHIAIAGELDAAPKNFAYLITWKSNIPTLKSCHFIEVPYVFGTIPPMKSMHEFFGWNSQAPLFMENIQKSWIAFAQVGDPSNPKVGNWPSFRLEDPKILVLDSETSLSTHPVNEIEQLISQYDVQFIC